MTLKDKVIVVTGGARDIGRAVSEKLAKEGAKLGINYFGSDAQAESLRAQFERDGIEAFLLKGDMTNQADVDELVRQTTDRFGEKIHGLVNIAGGLVQRKTIAEMDEDFFDFVIKLNLNSTFLTVKALTPLMSEGSAIVNFASQAGRDGGGPTR